MNITPRGQFAIKVASAMTIAYAVALWMNWDKAMWAAFAVAMISLETVGQSLQKGALRMAGTFLGVAVAFVLLGLFAQDRWHFMAALTLYVGFCTYMMMGPRRQYFWHVAGFVCAIVAFGAGPTVEASFDLATLRAQQTGLGILAFGLVAMLVWPSHSGDHFRQVAQNHANAEVELLRGYVELFYGGGDANACRQSRQVRNQHRGRLSQLQDAAEMDSYTIWESRLAWRRYQLSIDQYQERLERWRQSFPEVQSMELDRWFPGIGSLLDELVWRVDAIAAMHRGEMPNRRAGSIALQVASSNIDELSHFERAAVEVARSRLLALEQATRRMFHAAESALGRAEPASASCLETEGAVGAWLDPDRLIAVIRIVIVVWLAYLTFVLVPDLPGGLTFVTAAIPLGMVFAASPQLPAKALMIPVLGSLAFSGAVYLLVMPHLSSFMTLGPLIFIVSFAICFVFWKPQHTVARLLGLAIFAMVTGITNDQSYSFVGFASTSLMWVLLLLLFLVSAYWPVRMTPEAALLRLFRRFVRSAMYLLETLRWEGGAPPTRLHMLRCELHRQELASIPGKLRAWQRFIPPTALPAECNSNLTSVIDSLEELAFRIDDVRDARSRPQAAIVVERLLGDLRGWRVSIQENVGRLVSADYRREIAERRAFSEALKALEASIERELKDAPESELNAELRANLYRFLGALRDVGHAVGDVARAGLSIDWTRLREPRF